MAFEDQIPYRVHYLSDMGFGERFRHLKHLPLWDLAHELAWSVKKGELRADQVKFLLHEYSFLVEGILGEWERGFDEEEESLLKMGRRLAEYASEAVALSRSQLYEITRVMFRKEYTECLDPDKANWRAYVESLVRALDPEGLTTLGLTKEGLRVRLGPVWSEEAAYKVLWINECLNGQPTHPMGSRGPGTILHESIDPWSHEALEEATARASTVSAHTDEALLASLLDEPDMVPHCHLCLVREFQGLPPERLARIAHAVDVRLSRKEKALEESRLFVWELDDEKN